MSLIYNKSLISLINKSNINKILSSSLSSTIKIKNSLIETNAANTTISLDRDKSLTWYSCGPTVYDSAHLGHARTYVCTDIIRRILVNFFGIEVNYALGITDIDDKIIDKATEINSSKPCNFNDIYKLSRNLENEFFLDMDRLNIMRPSVVLRVTEHIDEIIQYISNIIDKGGAYVTKDGSVYFNVNKCGR
jgi:cysteinyl-tRNA synthetase